MIRLGNSITKIQNVRAVRHEVVGEHSEKPAAFRNDIVDLCGDLPRIELFAREKVDGWSSWGLEVESDLVFSGENYDIADMVK